MQIALESNGFLLHQKDVSGIFCQNTAARDADKTRAGNGSRVKEIPLTWPSGLATLGSRSKRPRLWARWRGGQWSVSTVFCLLFAPERRCAFIHHRSAAVRTGWSQSAIISGSSKVTVIEHPAISSEVTRLPTSERATRRPRFSSARRAALYIR